MFNDDSLTCHVTQFKQFHWLIIHFVFSVDARSTPEKSSRPGKDRKGQTYDPPSEYRGPSAQSEGSILLFYTMMYNINLFNLAGHVSLLF